MPKYKPLTWKRVLATIGMFKKIRNKDLADYLETNRQNIGVKLHQLKSWGMIRRGSKHRNEGVVLTDNGRNKLAYWEKYKTNIDAMSDKFQPCKTCQYSEWLTRSGMSPQNIAKAEDRGEIKG